MNTTFQIGIELEVLLSHHKKTTDEFEDLELSRIPSFLNLRWSILAVAVVLSLRSTMMLTLFTKGWKGMSVLSLMM
jgi:hypothetical protein